MFLLNLQALFAGSIPEIIDIMKTFPKFNGTYISQRGRRHVTNIFKNVKIIPIILVEKSCYSYLFLFTPIIIIIVISLFYYDNY